MFGPLLSAACVQPSPPGGVNEPECAPSRVTAATSRSSSPVPGGVLRVSAIWFVDWRDCVNSSKTGAGPTHPPAAALQISSPLHRSVPSQTPAEQVSPPMQVSPSSHTVPSGSSRQVDEQQSPSTVLPSSQVSPDSRKALPHRGVVAAIKAASMSVRLKERPLSGFVTSGPYALRSVRTSEGVSAGFASNSRAAPAAMKEADAEVPPKSMLPPPIRDVAVRQSGASTSRISSLLV